RKLERGVVLEPPPLHGRRSRLHVLSWSGWRHLRGVGQHLDSEHFRIVPRTGTSLGDRVGGCRPAKRGNACRAVRSIVEISLAAWAARRRGRSPRARSSRRCRWSDSYTRVRRGIPSIRLFSKALNKPALWKGARSGANIVGRRANTIG